MTQGLCTDKDIFAHVKDWISRHILIYAQWISNTEVISAMSNGAVVIVHYNEWKTQFKGMVYYSLSIIIII